VSDLYRVVCEGLKFKHCWLQHVSTYIEKIISWHLSVQLVEEEQNPKLMWNCAVRLTVLLHIYLQLTRSTSKLVRKYNVGFLLTVFCKVLRLCNVGK
jgi:hypothetical protein